MSNDKEQAFLKQTLTVNWAQVIVPALILVGSSYYMDSLNTAIVANELKHGFEKIAEIKTDTDNLDKRMKEQEIKSVEIANDIKMVGKSVLVLDEEIKEDFGWIGKRLDRIELRLPRSNEEE